MFFAKPSSKRGFQWKCKECNKIYQREHYKKNPNLQYERNDRNIREAYRFLNEIKSRPCMDCGHSFDPICMDFDHVRGKKSFSLSAAVRDGFSKKRMLAEIEKYEIVCSNCHRVRTHKRRLRNIDGDARIRNPEESSSNLDLGSTLIIEIN